VRVSDAEIARLAAYLGSTEFDFIQQFTRLRQDRRGLALKDQADGACIFLEQGGCRVQAVKPRQCREFPNRWNFPGYEKICRATPCEVSEAEYERRVGLS
jgi:Fe-S-cluster containining protein